MLICKVASCKAYDIKKSSKKQVRMKKFLKQIKNIIITMRCESSEIAVALQFPWSTLKLFFYSVFERHTDKTGKND